MKILPAILAVLFTLLPHAGAAQDVGDRYTVLGTIEGDLDGTPRRFLALYDNEKSRSFFNVNRLAGQPSFAIIAREFTDKGKLGRTTMVVTVEPPNIGAEGFHVARVRLIDGEGHKKPLRALADLDQTKLSDFDLGGDGRLSFGFEAEFLRYAGSEGKWQEQAGAPGAHFAGRFTGEVPESERGKLD